MTQETLRTLADLRRELLRDLATLQMEARRCESAIEHVEATICLLDPEFAWEPAEAGTLRVDEVSFQPGEIGRLALEILRDADSGLSTAQILDAILKRRAKVPADRAERRRFAQRLHAVLANLCRGGTLKRCGRTKAGGMGRPTSTLWTVQAELRPTRR